MTALFLMQLLSACSTEDFPDEGGGHSVPEGMVEVRPTLPQVFSAIPRVASKSVRATSRAYDPNETTANLLVNNPVIHLTEGSTVWLVAVSSNPNAQGKRLVKNSYVVYNSSNEEDAQSFLVPCNVKENGELKDMKGTPLYLKEGEEYQFFAISPARKLSDEMFAQGNLGFQVKNGEYFYANDCRYGETTPDKIEIKANVTDNAEAVQNITLKPMINQTAELRFQIDEGTGVHDLDIQPSGIEISGLQNDDPSSANPDGLFWHMSRSISDEPFKLQHGDKSGIYNSYNYTIDAQENVNIEVPILPMKSLSKPVIVIFRLKVNGVPTSYEVMLNEKDFKAGYSYGYRGKVSIKDGVDVITWQYISWETEVDFPFESKQSAKREK